MSFFPNHTYAGLTSFLWDKTLRGWLCLTPISRKHVLGSRRPEKAYLLSFLWPGELTTLTALDREKKDIYSLVAKATDGGGQSCQADVTLHVEDVNDNAPRFFPSHCAVAVFDNTTVKTPVAVVLARDPDQGENKDWKPFAHRVTLGKGLALGLVSLWTLKSKKCLSTNSIPKCYATKDFGNLLRPRQGTSPSLFLTATYT